MLWQCADSLQACSRSRRLTTLYQLSVGYITVPYNCHVCRKRSENEERPVVSWSLVLWTRSVSQEMLRMQNHCYLHPSWGAVYLTGWIVCLQVRRIRPVRELTGNRVMLLGTEEPITKGNMNAEWQDMNHSLHSK